MVGGGYSVSPLVPTDGCLIAMDGFNRVLRFEPDGPAPFIEVEAGMTIWELNEAIAPFGLRPLMPSLFPHPTLAGLMAVGGHGVGNRFGCFADGVDAIELIDARGELNRLERGGRDFEAATTSLGCLGAIYSVRVRLERDHRIRVRQRLIERPRFFAELDDLLRTHEAVEFFMLPQRSEVLLLTFERTTAPCTAPPKFELSRPHADIIGSKLQAIMGKTLAKRSPRTLYKLATELTRTHLRPRTWVDWASRGYHFQTCYPRNRNTCFAFGQDEAAVAIERFSGLLNSEMRRGRYPLTLALHARFTGASTSWLSPAHGRPTAQVDLVTHVEALGAKSFFDAVEEAWLDLPSARAHWGKTHSQPERLSERYPRFADFESARVRMDPDGVFLNEYLERSVGLGRGPAKSRFPGVEDASHETVNDERLTGS